MHWLDQMMVEPRLRGRLPVTRKAVTRQRNQANSGMAWIGPDATRDFEPVQVWESHIQDDDIGRHLVDERQCRAAITSAMTGGSSQLQHRTEHLSAVGI